MKITITDIRQYQNKMEGVKSIGDFKALGSELRSKFKLTDSEAINILNKNHEEVLKILENQEDM